MQTAYTIRVRERGQITLPQSVRTSLAVDAGDMLSLVQIGDIVLLSLKPTLIPKLSQEFSALMQEEGMSLAELLQGLEEERTSIWQERYARDA